MELLNMLDGNEFGGICGRVAQFLCDATKQDSRVTFDERFREGSLQEAVVLKAAFEFQIRRLLPRVIKGDEGAVREYELACRVFTRLQASIDLHSIDT